MNWDINEAIGLCRLIEPIAIAKGYHVALGGSVLINGTAEKDCDIFLYQHTKFSGNITRGKIEPMLSALTEIGFKVREDVYTNDKPKSSGDNYYKVVEKTEYMNKRVDIIFLLAP